MTDGTVRLYNSVTVPLRQPLRYGHRGDFGRTKIIGTQVATIDMVFDVNCQLFVVLWNAKVAMGWMIRGKQSVEKTVEFAFVDVAHIADFDSGR